MLTKNYYQIQYYLGGIIALPLLPLLYYQGKNIRKKVPRLPEASGTKGRSNSSSSEINQPLQLITIGESTIAGVGVERHEEGFTGSLANALAQAYNCQVNWEVFAKSGYTAKQVNERLLKKVAAKKADLIVIGLGGNDAFTLNNPKRWTQDCKELIRMLQEKYPEAALFFCNMPPIKEFPAFTKPIKWVIGNLVELLGKSLNENVKDTPSVYYNSEVVKLKTWLDRYELQKTRDDLFSDGVHPAKITYQTWGRDMAQFIKRNIPTLHA